MGSFLGEVARSLYSKWGGDLSSLTLLFPSRRARLFFVEELSSLTQTPIWEPQWLSIDDLLEQLSGINRGDRVRLVIELYKVYSKYHKEELDRFYFWGEMLLSDFDMIDKYRVDAKMLFRNISDLKELEADLSYLTPQQRAIINRFWEGVLKESSESEERRQFLAIWNSLYPIYEEYRTRLLKLGFAYTGMIHRLATDRLLAGECDVDCSQRYVVAGFNALSECEKILFKRLKALGADFYWDYDRTYLQSQEQEAGIFMRENISLFDESLGEVTHDNMLSQKEFSVISTVSDAVQCKYVSSILEDFRQRDEKGVLQPLDKRTAIVLTDENLLSPLIHSLSSPDELKQTERVNVTMGFPLIQSAAYTFVERLLTLQSHANNSSKRGLCFYHSDVTGLLSHPYLSGVDGIDRLYSEVVEERRVMVEQSCLEEGELLKSIFSSVGDWRSLSEYLLLALRGVGSMICEGDDMQMHASFLSEICCEISKLQNSLVKCDIDISTSIYTSLLRRHLQRVRIPFEGEPLDGIQVMGILETRNLDFDNVVILSMTDDNFPGKLDSSSSYIPYNLRAAYQLPTPEHHEGVYSYYFYRLLQRSKRVALCYCSQADKMSTGEPSRYIRQLEFESGRELRYVEVGVDVNLPAQEPITVEKIGSVRESLERYLNQKEDRKISPTALSRYIACPLKFYFCSIAHLKEKEEVSDDVDSALFGNILHRSMELLYEPLKGVLSPRQELVSLSNGDTVERVVARVIDEEIYGGNRTGKDEYPGNVLLVSDIIVRYIKSGILPYDAQNSDFTVRGLEQPVDSYFDIGDGRRVHFAGFSDRLDTLGDGSFRVVDYKTGRVHLEFNGLEDLFVSKNRSLNANMFQTMLYSMMLNHSHGVDAMPSLYYVRNINKPDFSPYLKDHTQPDLKVVYSLYKGEFEQMLREQLQELFDYDKPFEQCSDLEVCKFCEFKKICRRTTL